MAKNIKTEEIINMSNVNYVYDKAPRKHRDAKKIESIRWKNFTKLVGSKWKAGMHAPFDPVAAKEAEKSKLKVYIIGRDLRNLENLLNGKKFKDLTTDQKRKRKNLNRESEFALRALMLASSINQHTR